MNQNHLGENIARYRNEKGLSQEKVSEYMGVSRQAVTKWENNISKPSSENLIKLAKLFDISVDALLDNIEYKDTGNITKVKTSKMSWAFIGITVTCIIFYVILSNKLDQFSPGTLICMFMISVPIQLFLHIFFSNAINNDSLSGIAGFDEKTEYNFMEVKKLLVQIDLQIGMLSTVYVFLLCAMNCMDLKIGWFNGLLIALYSLNFVAVILVNNYKMTDKIFCRDEDKKRAIRSMPVTVVYLLVLFLGMGITVFLFEAKGIENNTAPAIKVGGLLLSGILIATIGFFLENSDIKKWNPNKTKHKTNKISIASLFVCLILYGFMCISS